MKPVQRVFSIRGRSPLWCKIYAFGFLPTRAQSSQWSRCFHSRSANEPGTRAALCSPRPLHPRGRLNTEMPTGEFRVTIEEVGAGRTRMSFVTTFPSTRPWSSYSPRRGGRPDPDRRPDPRHLHRRRGGWPSRWGGVLALRDKGPAAGRWETHQRDRDGASQRSLQASERHAGRAHELDGFAASWRAQRVRSGRPMGPRPGARRPGRRRARRRGQRRPPEPDPEAAVSARCG